MREEGAIRDVQSNPSGSGQQQCGPSDGDVRRRPGPSKWSPGAGCARQRTPRWRTRVRGRDRARGHGVHFLANCFTTANRIVEAAHEWGADVIMVGSTRRRFLRRSLGKGLRERITSLTCLPVLTGPAPLRVAGHLRVADLTGQPTDTTRVESIV